MEKRRGLVHSHVVEALHELSDERRQRRLWTSTGGSVSSLTECRCQLFDDSGLGHELDRGGVVYSPSVDEALRRLREVLNRIGGARTPEAILGDAQLPIARAMAAALLVDLREFPEP
jgi:hypothetical protein